MKLIIHNVGHGTCISLIHGYQAMLWDCGCSDDEKPSNFLERENVCEIKCLTISNFDNDHIKGLPDLLQNFKILELRRHKLRNDVIADIKKKSGSEITHAMTAAFDMNNRYNKTSNLAEFPGVTVKTFHNRFGYGVDEFSDTNNLSLVSFVTVNRTKIIIPGDLETKGWETLIKRQDFRNELKDVDIFVASHHGRSTGYCENLFKDGIYHGLCQPKVFIFSDKDITHGTQEGMARRYGSLIVDPKCSFNTKTKEAFVIDGQKNTFLTMLLENHEDRYVLTTRKDGTFYFNL